MDTDRKTMELTSFATGQSQKSNDNAPARVLLAAHQSSSLKTIAQKPLHRNKNHAAPQQEASVIRSSGRRSLKKSVPTLRLGAKVVQNEERQMVC